MCHDIEIRTPIGRSPPRTTLVIVGDPDFRTLVFTNSRSECVQKVAQPVVSDFDSWFCDDLEGTATSK
jgi:hypothetical protein